MPEHRVRAVAVERGGSISRGSRRNTGIDSHVMVDSVTSRYVTIIDSFVSYSPRSTQIAISGNATATGGRKRSDSRKNWMSRLPRIG